jgi:hypothetical protein
VTPQESLKRQILEAVSRQPAQVRPRRALSWTATVAIAAIAMVAAYAAELGLVALRKGGGLAPAAGAVTSGLERLLGLGAVTAGRPAVAGVPIVFGTILLAAVATWLVLPSRRSMLSPPRGRLLAIALGLPVLVGVWHLVWGFTYVDPYVARVSWPCITLTLATAPWPFLAVYRASRRLDPRHPAITGAALGSAAGAWGAVMAAIWCPLSLGPHVLVGHVLPLVFSVGLGAMVGYRMFRVRRVRLVAAPFGAHPPRP